MNRGERFGGGDDNAGAEWQNLGGDDMGDRWDNLGNDNQQGNMGEQWVDMSGREGLLATPLDGPQNFHNRDTTNKDGRTEILAANSTTEENLEDVTNTSNAVKEKLSKFRDMEAPLTKEEKALLDVMDSIRSQREEKFRQERMQEIAEREILPTLTTVDDLENEIIEKTGRVSKETIEYDGKQVPVYTLKGYPLKCFIHAIDYKGRVDKRLLYDDGMIGRQTAYRLQEDPSSWMKTLDDVKESAQQSSEGLSSTLSLTMFDSSKNFERVAKRFPGGVPVWGDVWDYGFSKLKPRSILTIAPGDAGTPQVSGKNPEASFDKNLYTREEAERMLEDGGFQTNIRDPNLAMHYNETLASRYDEDGKVVKPDFMVTSSRNGAGPSETMLRHAAFFDVPVFKIDIDAYQQEEAREIHDLAYSLYANPQVGKSYQDLVGDFDRIQRSWLVDWNSANDDLINPPEKTIDQMFSGVIRGDEARHLVRMERELRMDYIQEQLVKEAERIERENNEGKIAEAGSLIVSPIMGTIVANLDGSFSYPDGPIGIKINVRTERGRSLEVQLPIPKESDTTEPGGGEYYYKRLVPSIEKFEAAKEADRSLRRERFEEEKRKRES